MALVNNRKREIEVKEEKEKKETVSKKFFIEVCRKTTIKALNVKGIEVDTEVYLDKDGKYKLLFGEDGKPLFYEKGNKKGKQKSQFFPINEKNLITNDLMLDDKKVTKITENIGLLGKNGDDNDMMQVTLVLKPDYLGIEQSVEYKDDNGIKLIVNPVEYNKHLIATFVGVTEKVFNPKTKKKDKTEFKVNSSTGVLEYEFSAYDDASLDPITFEIPYGNGEIENIITKEVIAELDEYRKSLTRLSWLKIKILRQGGKHYLAFTKYTDDTKLSIVNQLPVIFDMP